jgi:RNase P subunit RPR2
MRLEIFIIGLTAFFVYNAYHDGKYTKMLLSFKKYYQMIFYVVIGVSIYLLLKKNPVQGKNLLLYANNMVKYMPIDRGTMDMITPIFDLTRGNPQQNQGSFMESFNNIQPAFYNHGSEQRILSSGKTGTKRSVSETKKKYVAAQQEWKCKHCDQPLNAWFEVDHKVRLEHGGGNDVSNLVALCRECHGKKTALENM